MMKIKPNLWIFTKKEFDQLPDGIELKSVTNRIVVKGKDYIDLDTRGRRHIAYGVADPWNHKEKHLFLMFGLCQE